MPQKSNLYLGQLKVLLPYSEDLPKLMQKGIMRKASYKVGGIVEIKREFAKSIWAKIDAAFSPKHPETSPAVITA